MKFIACVRVAKRARLALVKSGIPHVSIAADNATQVMTRNAASQLLRQPGYCCGKHHAITFRTVSLVIAFDYVLALLVWNDFWYRV